MVAYGNPIDSALWKIHNRRMQDHFDIATIRETLGLTQTALADKIGVAQGDVSNWENRKHKPSRAARATIERLLAEHQQGRAA